jgi:hypothetical protein
MRKSVFGLAVAGATLAGAISSASPASAIIYSLHGYGPSYDGDYDVTTVTGTFTELSQTLTTNVFWGNRFLATRLARTVKGDLGYPNNNLYPPANNYGPFGPFFAVETRNLGTVVDGYAWNGGNPSYPDPTLFVASDFLSGTETYALATAVPVPWETDAISVIGSTILFAGGLWARNKFAKPLQK